MVKIGAMVIGLVLWTAPAHAQDAREILEQTASTYKNAEHYEIEGTIQIKMEAGGREQATDISLYMAESEPSQRLRVEIEGAGMELTVVSDGEMTWMFIPSLNQYMEQAGAFNPAAAGTVLPDIIGEYKGLADSVSSAEILREETIQMQEEERPAWVLGVDYIPRKTSSGADSTYRTFWIDQERKVVLKEVTRAHLSESPAGMPMKINEQMLFKTARIGEPVQDTLFVFNPPPGAREIRPDEIYGDPGSDLANAEAIDFTLESIEGNQVNLESLRGKIVLVNFWATWCGPCRIEMPVLEKIYREFSDHGLVILAVNVAETTEDVEAYLAENDYTYTILLDADGSVASQYGASGIPTSVIIDREGRITRRFVGAYPEDMFRLALEELGLE